MNLKIISNNHLFHFKIYAEFECNVKRVKSSNKNNNSYTEKYHISCSFAYKVVCIGNKFSKPVVLCRRKNGIFRFIEAILKEMNYWKKIIKKHFNKNFVMSAEDEEKFQLSNICRICNKVFDVQYEKVMTVI